MNELQRTAEWHRQREGKLTASNFAQAAGIGPGSRQQLWRRLTGAEEFEQNSAMQWGIDMEEVALEDYITSTGKLPANVTMAGFVAHPKHDWLGASPDLLIDDVFDPSFAPGVGEIKCPVARVLYDEIPTYYMAQVQGLMEVTDREWCDFICWTPTHMRVWRVERSREYWVWLHARLVEFWKFVTDKTQPPRAARPTAPDLLVSVGAPLTYAVSGLR